MRGRKTHAAPDAAEDIIDINHDALAEAGRAGVVVAQNTLALQAAYDLTDMTPDTLVREIKLWIDASARAMYEVGIRLAALREMSPHGDWAARVRDEIGMSPRTAQRYIAAAAKCKGDMGRRDRLMQLSRSKMLELTALDDSQLDELEATGGISQLELDFDEIDRMSLTELRDRLRDREQVLAAKDVRIKKQRDEIDRLQDHIERPFKADADAATSEERALLDAVRDSVVQAETHLLQLGTLLPRAADGSVSEACALAVRQGAEYLAQRLAGVLNDAGLDVQFEEMVTPAWVRKAKATKSQRATKQDA